MSEDWGQQGTADFAGQPAANDTLTAGDLLHRAREAAGLHVGALAVALKVPVRKIEALENDRLDELPDAVFVRALASSICRTLKIDPQPVLDRLPQTAAPRLLHTGDGLNTTFRSPSDGAAPGLLDQLTKPVLLAVFALLLGALVLVLLPSVSEDSRLAAATTSLLSFSSPQQAAPPATAVEAAPIGVPAANAARPAVPDATPAAAPALDVSTAASAAAPASAPGVAAAPALAAASAAGPAPAPVAGGDAAPGGDPATVAHDPAAPADGIVVFRTRGTSWVEVTDAKGVVAVRRLLGAGEAAGASGALPLQVTIGRVDATEVQVRGKPFDLRPVSRDNVARFEVK